MSKYQSLSLVLSQQSLLSVPTSKYQTLHNQVFFRNRKCEEPNQSETNSDAKLFLKTFKLDTIHLAEAMIFFEILEKPCYMKMKKKYNSL